MKVGGSFVLRTKLFYGVPYAAPMVVVENTWESERLEPYFLDQGENIEMISAYVDYQEMRGKPKRYIIRPIVKAENKSGDCSGVISRVGQKQQSDYFSLWKSSSRYCNP